MLSVVGGMAALSIAVTWLMSSSLMQNQIAQGGVNQALMGGEARRWGQALRAAYYDQWLKVRARQTNWEADDYSQWLSAAGLICRGWSVLSSGGGSLSARIDPAVFGEGTTSLGTGWNVRVTALNQHNLGPRLNTRIAPGPLPVIAGGLSGVSGFVESIPVELEFSPDGIKYRVTLYAAEIPPGSLAMASDGGLAVDDTITATVQGNSLLRGGLTNGAGLNLEGNLQSANVTGSSAKIAGQAASSLDGDRDGINFRGRSEMGVGAAGKLRDSQNQSANQLASVIPAPNLNREGMGEVVSPDQQDLYRSIQPYYQVPPSQRILAGMTGPVNEDKPELSISLDAGSGLESNVSALPPWATLASRVHNGFTPPDNVFLVLRLDLGAVTPDAEGRIRVFAGIKQDGTYGAEKAIIGIMPSQFPAGVTEVTVISPNVICVLGDFNTVNPVHATLSARRVVYGWQTMEEVDSAGSISALTTDTARFGVKSYLGADPASRTVSITADNVAISGGMNYRLSVWMDCNLQK